MFKIIHHYDGFGKDIKEGQPLDAIDRYYKGLTSTSAEWKGFRVDIRCRDGKVVEHEITIPKGTRGYKKLINEFDEFCDKQAYNLIFPKTT